MVKKQEKSPFELLGKTLAKKREQVTKENNRKSKSNDTTVVRAEKEQVKQIKRLILDYEEYGNITEFVIIAVEEKLEKERAKHK